MTRLFILDDEMMIRQGIRYAINWEEHDIVVCGEASNGRAALRSLPSSGHPAAGVRPPCSAS